MPHALEHDLPTAAIVEGRATNDGSSDAAVLIRHSGEGSHKHDDDPTCFRLQSTGEGDLRAGLAGDGVAYAVTEVEDHVVVLNLVARGDKEPAAVV